MYYRLSHDVVTWDGVMTLGLLTASLLQAIRSIDDTTSFISQRSTVIGASRSTHCSIVPAGSCSLSGALLFRFLLVVYFDRGHPCFWNFTSTIPVDIIRVKAYANSFLDHTCVLLVMISINKFDLVPDRIVDGLVLEKTSSKQSKRRDLHLKVTSNLRGATSVDFFFFQ